MPTVRRTGTSSIATLCGVALTVAVLNAFAPSWVQQSGLDVWNLPSAISDGKTADHDSASLKAQEQRLFQEIQLSKIVAGALAAGTLSLKDAVDEMEPILRNRSGFIAAIQTNYETSYIREGIARYLISRIPKAAQHDRDEPLSDTLSRLECELNSLNKG